jgi:hypothetical protein
MHFALFVVVLTTTLVAITTGTASAQSLDSKFRIDDGEIRGRMSYGSEYRHIASGDVSGGVGISADSYSGDYVFQSMAFAIGSEHKSWYWELFGEVDAWSWNDDYRRIQPMYLGGTFPAKRQEDRAGIEFGFGDNSFQFYVKGWYLLGDWQFNGSRGPEMQAVFGGGIRGATDGFKIDVFGGSDRAELYLGFPAWNNGLPERVNPTNPAQRSAAIPGSVETGPYLRGSYQWNTWQVTPADWTRTVWYGEVGWELQAGPINLRAGARYTEMLGEFEGVGGDGLKIAGWGAFAQLTIGF